MQIVQLQVTGKVQGVSFRISTARKARSLGMTGWVRNKPDGSVEIFAQANSESMIEFVDWCHHGPPLAVVEKIIRKNLNSPLEEQLTSFEIRR